ncbi:phage integrase SAM-like domain-containing protein [Spirosoma sp. 48-14]|nr:phage integrase SAM-like domain-containing protein [Spirosoma sp. 48-14]OJW76285.1 MAG: hypothetical protein BGO59_22465 [Spirosoma sp. 48-14]
MQILFKLRRNYRKSKKGKPKPTDVAIYARITVNGRTADQTTGVKVHPKFWNQTKQKISDGWPTADQDNELLDRIRVNLKKAFNRLDQDDTQLQATQVLDVYRGKSQERCTLQTLMNRFIEYEKNQVSSDPVKLATKEFITHDTYKTNVKYCKNISAYLLDSKQPRAYVDEIDESWLISFRNWGSKRYKVNYLAKHLAHIKRLVSFAVLKKIIPSNPIAPYKIYTEEPDPDDRVFLYPEELERLTTFDFQSLNLKPERANRLERVRDAFVFMEAIGTHLGEYTRFVADPKSALTEREGIWFLKKKRSKTRKYFTVHLKPINFELAAKYGGFDKLPVYSRTQFNDALTIISALLGFDKQLTSKAARKTFADSHLNESTTDLHVTARMMGLSSIQHLGNYASIDERRIIRELGLKPQVVQES